MQFTKMEVGGLSIKLHHPVRATIDVSEAEEAFVVQAPCQLLSSKNPQCLLIDGGVVKVGGHMCVFDQHWKKYLSLQLSLCLFCAVSGSFYLDKGAIKEWKDSKEQRQKGGPWSFVLTRSRLGERKKRETEFVRLPKYIYRKAKARLGMQVKRERKKERKKAPATAP